MISFKEQIKPIRLTIGTTVDKGTAKGTVFGRDELVAELWNTLETSSVNILGERRIGKTWVLRLAQALQPNWAETFWFDAEKVHTTQEFVRRLNRELAKQGLLFTKPITKIVKTPINWIRRAGLGFGEIKGTVQLKNPDRWPLFLESTIREFAQCAVSKKAVLMIDELPLCLESISANQGEKEATKLLDELRALRMTIPSLRMAFCGSLGMHIVLGKFHDAGYKGRPTNDLVSFDVLPLSEFYAKLFAGSLLIGEDIDYTDLEQVSLAAAETGSRVPYYIQHIIKYMKNKPRHPFSPTEVAAIPEKLFEAAGDPAEFKYHNERLTLYYPDDIADKARVVLDVLSNLAEGVDDQTLLNLVKHNPLTVTTEPGSLQEVLGILQDDHYIEKVDGRWKFKVSIIRRWWSMTRGRMS